MGDTGAGLCFVDKTFLASNKIKSPRIKLPQPFDLETIDGQTSLHNRIHESIKLTIWLGNKSFTRDFLITNLGTHNMVLGLDWFREYDPDIVYSTGEIKGFRKPTTNRPNLSTKTSNLTFGPCTDTKIAFKAGGVISAIETEQFNRKQIGQSYSTLFNTQKHVEQALSIKAYAGSINGLTGNTQGWEQTIPPQYHKFLNTVFSDQSAKTLPPHRHGQDCSITIREGEQLSTCKVYDMSEEQLKILKQIIDENIKKGFFRESKSQASSPVFFVTDKASNSRGTDQLRLVIDYRSLNSKIVLDEYSIPLIRTVMQRLSKAKIYTKFDVRAGFNNLRIKEGDEWKTAFKTFWGTYEYLVMPMGLATAPATFQRFINSVLSPYLELYCFAYLDDIIVFSENKEEHEKHVTTILETLEKHNLHLKPVKCGWHLDKVDFLGLTAETGKGVRMSDDKIQALHKWKAPTNKLEIQQLTGLSNFYRDMIPHYSDVVSPLTELTGKVPFEWNSRRQQSFDTLMTHIRNDVFIHGYDPNLPTLLETDASNLAYGGVVSQLVNGKHYPILMFSHKFKDNEKEWTVSEKELYAIIYAMDKYSHFLQNKHPLKIYSDHRNLARFMFTTKLTGRIARWFDKIQGCGINFSIEYRAGKENTVADTLSRYQLTDQTNRDSDYKALLPQNRFSAKALADIKLYLDQQPLKSTGKPAQITPRFGFDTTAYRQKLDPATRLAHTRLNHTDIRPTRLGLGN